MALLAAALPQALAVATPAASPASGPASVHAPRDRVARPPNIVLFLVDDLGWSDTGAYGNTYHRTPGIDALARRGLRFTHAYAAAPVCSPSRAALLTGVAPARLGLTDWLPGPPADGRHNVLPPALPPGLPAGVPTLAERLAARGYATALVGKWHLGGDGYGPGDRGFGIHIGGDATGTPRSYFWPYRDAEGQMPGLQAGRPGEYLTDRLTIEAEHFIEANRDRPFFLYLAHYAVHVPMQARPDLDARWRAVPRPAGVPSGATYAAMLESVDASLADILATLDRLGLADRTLVVFTSDNGGLVTAEGPGTPPTTNAPLRAGKGSLYEGGLRVPLVMAGAGVARTGATESAPVSAMDLYATLAALGGDGQGARDGASFAPVLAGAARESRPLFWHYPHWSPQGGRPGGVVREGDWKLIEFYDDGHVELYDLARDPGEARDLAAAEPARAARLQGMLHDWLSATGARPMTPAPAPWWKFWAR